MKKLKDFVKIEDSGLRGEVSFYKNGEFLFKKTNMIVENGRKYLKEIFLEKAGLSGEGKLLSATEDTIHWSNLIFDKIILGTGANATTKDMVYNNIKGTLIPAYSVSLNNFNNTAGSSNTIERNLGENSIIFKINILGNSEYPILAKELVILLQEEGSTNENTQILFSRLSFDGVPLGAGSDLELEYHIYF